MARNRNEDEDDDTDLSISSDDGQDDDDLEDGDEDGDDEDDGSDLDDGDGDDDGDGEDDQDGDDDGEEEADDDADDDADEDEDDDLDPDDPDLAAIASEGDDPPASIPYARVVEMVEKARQEGAAGKPADPPAEPEFDLKAKVAERNKALLDGDEDKATELDLEIEEYRTKEAERRVAAQLQADRATAQLNKAVKHVMAKYPALNDQNSKYYDPEAVQDVRALRDTYIRERGMAPAAALLKAADRYFGKAAKTAKGEGEEGKDGKGGKQPKETDRLRRLLKRARKAKAQPATPTGKRGSPNRGAAAIDFESLTEDDLTDDMIRRLEKENPKLLARLQGDIA